MMRQPSDIRMDQDAALETDGADARAFVLSSGLFDAEWYRARMPVALSETMTDSDLVNHFLDEGTRLCLSPGPLFDTEQYFSRAWHLEPGIDNALLHYLHSGRNEGQIAEGVCDPALLGGMGPVERSRLTQMPRVRPIVTVVVQARDMPTFRRICERLGSFPCHFSLLALVDSEEQVSVAEEIVDRASLEIITLFRVSPEPSYNPAFVFSVFRNALRNSDIILYLHTAAGTTGDALFDVLAPNLLPPTDAVAGILTHFDQNPHLGLLQAAPVSSVPDWTFGWQGHRPAGQSFLDRVAHGAVAPQYAFDHPCGGMFWARTSALKTIIENSWSEEDFYVETGQSVAAFAPVFERCVGLVAQAHGFRSDEYDAEAGLVRIGWGARSYGDRRCLSMAVLKEVVLESRVVSFDIFDTLLNRIILTPDAVLRYAGVRVAAIWPEAADFFARRKQAEDHARAALGWTDDVGLDDIYQALGALTGWSDAVLECARREEIELDRRLLRPRAEMIEVLRFARENERRVILVSDTFLGRDELDPILQRCGILPLVDEIYLSSERRARKDRGDMWDLVKAAEGAEEFLHIGDNEHSDIANAVIRGIRTFQVPSGLASLSLSPIARDVPVTDIPDFSREILTGPLVATLFNSPFPADGAVKVLQTPQELGRILFGPLLLSFMAKLVRHPVVEKVDRLFFLAREGYFLSRLYDLFRDRWFPDLPEGVYFHCSRRAALNAALSTCLSPDLVAESGSGFKGTVAELLYVRLGYKADPNSSLWTQQISLPADNDTVRALVGLLHDDILDQAKGGADRLRAYARARGIELDSGRLYGLVDVGYSGTIQRHLQSVTKARFAGLYMATTAAARRVEDTGGLAFGLFATGSGADEFQRTCSLMIEAVLTAPHGQTMGYDEAIPPSPVFGPDGVAQENFSVLEDIFEGIVDYCIEIMESYGPSVIAALQNSESVAMTALGAFAEGRLKIAPEIADQLSIEDRFCGKGEIFIFRHRS